MASIPTNIVMVQYFPGTEEYIVYREGSEPELHRGGIAATDQDFYQYAQECAACGCAYETTFHAATGKVSGDVFVVCKQIIYCKAMASGASAHAAMSGAKNAASGALGSLINAVGGNAAVKKGSQVAQSSIVWVKWDPAAYELVVCAGKLPLPKTYRIHTLDEAPEEILEFMLHCFKKRYIALSRSYRRSVQDGKVSHMAIVTDYYFSVNKSHKDFQGGGVEKLTRGDMSKLGFEF